MELETIVGGFIVTVIGGLLLVAIVWGVKLIQRIVRNRVSHPAEDVPAMQLLKAMREQIRGKTGYNVDAVAAATGLGMDFSSEEVDRHLYWLVRAEYLQEDSRRAMTSSGVYQITPAGIEAADNY